MNNERLKCIIEQHNKFKTRLIASGLKRTVIDMNDLITAVIDYKNEERSGQICSTCRIFLDEIPVSHGGPVSLCLC